MRRLRGGDTLEPTANVPRAVLAGSNLLTRPGDSACTRYPANLMGASLYHVHADWDPEASVWVATSTDVPGLATEAATLEALAEKLRIMIPELLEANQLLAGDPPEAISFELTGHRLATPRTLF